MKNFKVTYHLTSIVVIVAVLLMLISCAKKTTTTRSETKIERIRNVAVGFPPSENSFDVTIECDPVTNLPKPLQKTFKTDKKSTTATIDGNNLNISNKVDSVIVYLPCKDIVSSTETDVKKVVTIMPWWVIYVIGYSVIITVLFLKKLFI